MHSPWMMEKALPPPVFVHSPEPAAPAAVVVRKSKEPTGSGSARIAVIAALALLVLGGLGAIGYLVKTQLLGRARGRDEGAVKVDAPKGNEGPSGTSKAASTDEPSTRPPPQLATDAIPTPPPYSTAHSGIHPTATSAPTPPPTGGGQKFDPSGI